MTLKEISVTGAYFPKVKKCLKCNALLLMPVHRVVYYAEVPILKGHNTDDYENFWQCQNCGSCYKEIQK